MQIIKETFITLKTQIVDYKGIHVSAFYLFILY